MKRNVIEHLVDCAHDPALKELYGELQGKYCLNPDGGLLQGFGGMFNQALTIGFLVMSYYFFKRSANGITEWEEADDDDDFAMDQSFSSSSGIGNKNMRRCLQCNGTGKFEWDGSGGSSICDLCNGSGFIPKIARIKTFGLPKSSRQLWNPDNNEFNGDDDDTDDNFDPPDRRPRA
jgi:hypothetical protein